MMEQELQSFVEHWDVVSIKNIRYFYLFNYYPTKCEFGISQRDWDIRYLIWHFKFDRSKGITEMQHNHALNILIPLIKKVLLSTFRERVGDLTLVCIAASTKVINKDRYEDFSNRLCSELNMNNAYSHIVVVRDRASKREGGELKRCDIEFDKPFFKGKQILLFDDLLTTGTNMLRYAVTLKSFGATIIGGLTIGKTQHERIEKHPIEQVILDFNQIRINSQLKI